MFGPGKREPLAINRGYARCDAGLDLFDVRGEMAAYSGLFHLPRHVNLWPNRRLSQVCELQTQRAREGVSPFAHDDPGVAPPNVFPMPSQAGNSRNAK
jgi:hypothetical protein